jgi:hypothetical protein
MTHGATPEAVVVMGGGGGTKKSRNKKRGRRTWASSGAGALPPPFYPGPRVALALARPALHVVLEKRIHAPPGRPQAAPEPNHRPESAPQMPLGPGNALGTRGRRSSSAMPLTRNTKPRMHRSTEELKAIFELQQVL